MEVIATSGLSVMAAAALLCCGCLSDNSYAAPQQEEQEQSESAGAKVYTIKAPYATYETEVPELSSICLKPSSDGFFAVGDEGEVFELDLHGRTVSRLREGDGHDWEGVDCRGDDIFLMEESESALYRLSGGNLSEVAKIRIPDGGVSGKGPEGLMIVGDIAYIGNQASPTRIVKYSLEESKTCGYFDIGFVKKYISDLCFDPVDNTMWLVDSKGPAFHHCSLDGKLIATYNIDFVEQAEAIAIDHGSGTVWIGCDVTSKLYEIKVEL